MNKTINQTKLYVLSHIFNEIVDLFTSKNYQIKFCLADQKVVEKQLWLIIL